MLQAPAVDGLELGTIGPKGYRLVPVICALLQACQEILAGSTPIGSPGEEEELFRVLKSEQCSYDVEIRDRGHLLDALASGRTRAREDQPADELRFVLHDHLGDHAAHGEGEEVNLVETQRPDEGNGVLRHRLDLDCPAPGARRCRRSRPAGRRCTRAWLRPWSAPARPAG